MRTTKQLAADRSNARSTSPRTGAHKLRLGVRDPEQRIANEANFISQPQHLQRQFASAKRTHFRTPSLSGGARQPRRTRIQERTQFRLPTPTVHTPAPRQSEPIFEPEAAPRPGRTRPNENSQTNPIPPRNPNNPNPQPPRKTNPFSTPIPTTLANGHIIDKNRELGHTPHI
jgi:hypothetical protein